MSTKTPYILAACLSAWSAVARAVPSQATGAGVRVVVQDGSYALMRNGQPFSIKGAGEGAQHLYEALRAGANSIREWSPDKKTLQRVRAKGMAALVGLTLSIPRQGFDYLEAAAVQKQLEKTVTTVLRLKFNSTVLIWALGNEVELGAPDEQRIAAWKALEQLARAVKSEDPAHPVIAVPSLDAVGIDTYGGILGLPEASTAQSFRRPYIVTEFGARGHWEVAKIAWSMPIEDTSSQKAAFIAKGYEHATAHRTQCLDHMFSCGVKSRKNADLVRSLS